MSWPVTVPQLAAEPFRVTSICGTEAPFVMSISRYSFGMLLSWKVYDVVKAAHPSPATTPPPSAEPLDVAFGTAAELAPANSCSASAAVAASVPSFRMCFVVTGSSNVPDPAPPGVNRRGRYPRFVATFAPVSRPGTEVLPTVRRMSRQGVRHPYRCQGRRADLVSPV